MPRTLVSLLLAALLWPAVLHAGDGDRIALVIDDQKISDNDRAALYEAILATIPMDQWKSVKTTAAGTVATVVDDYYDYWFDPKEEDPAKTYLKATTKLLSTKIREANGAKIDAANGIKAGTTLRIPPLPVRATTANGSGAAARTFDTKTASYTKFGSFETAALMSVEPLSKPMVLAKKLEAFHKVTATSIEVDWKSLQRILRTGNFRLPDGAVLLKTSNEEIELTFPSDPPDSDAADPWLLNSAHAEDAATEWQRDRDRLAVVLTTPPPEFWVVDWWDTPATVSHPWGTGHGAKVVSVIHKVLDDLQLDATLGPLVKTFDLNPKNNRQELSRTLDAFEARYSKGVTEADSKRFFADARAWIAKDPATGVNTSGEVTARIDEFVMQSIFWKFFSQKSVLVNLSWSMNRPQFMLLDSVYMDRTSSFAVIAAGNNHTPIASDSYPQIGAATNLNLVNVTYAKPNGQVLGAFHVLDQVPVHLAARGDGFEFREIHVADTGSSFASPYVAAYAWVKMLFDGVPVKELRSALLRSARPVGARPKMVAAGGLFEPEFLFLPSTAAPHIVMGNQRLSLVGARVTVYYTDDTGNPREWPILVTSTLQQGKVYVFPDTAGNFMVWRRSNEGAHEVDIYPVQKIVIARPGVAPIELTPSAFVAQVSDLCF